VNRLVGSLVKPLLQAAMNILEVEDFLDFFSLVKPELL
jgi:hypothetical protein